MAVTVRPTRRALFGLPRDGPAPSVDDRNTRAPGSRHGGRGTRWCAPPYPVRGVLEPMVRLVCNAIQVRPLASTPSSVWVRRTWANDLGQRRNTCRYFLGYFLSC